MNDITFNVHNITCKETSPPAVITINLQNIPARLLVQADSQLQQQQSDQQISPNHQTVR